MLLQALGVGLVSLGLVGGTAAIRYDERGSATVKFAEHGKTRTITLGVARAPGYSCPVDVAQQLAPTDGLSARIKLTLREVGAELDRIEANNPGRVAPPGVARRYNGLAARERRLAKSFNRSVAEHNAVLADSCTKD